MPRVVRTVLRGGRALPDRHRRRAFGRELFFHAAKRFTPTLTVDSIGGRVQLSTADHGVGKTLFMGDDVEHRTLALALALLRERGAPTLQAPMFVDIGANIGTTTLAAIGAFGLREAVCFEPEPGNLSLLRQNIVANGMSDRVKVIGAALSDTEGTVEFEVAPDNPSDSRVRVRGGGRGDQLGESSWPVHTVPTTTFDHQVAAGVIDPGSTALVWIDAQGHEGHILKGAGSLVGSGLPVVIEYWPYGLRRAGGMALLVEAISQFGSIFDLGDDPPVQRDVATLAGLEARYPEASSTDLLVLPR